MEKEQKKTIDEGFKFNWSNKEKALKNLEYEKMLKELNIKKYD